MFKKNVFLLKNNTPRLAAGYLFFMLLSLIVQAAPEPLDKVVAVVNDQVITQSELQKQVELVDKQLQLSNTPVPEPDVLRKQVLQHLIDVDLQIQTAKQLGIEIDETKLNDALRDIAKRNNVTMEQMRQQVEQQGISYQEYRDNIKKQMTLSQLQQKAVGSSITISEDQVSHFMKSTQEQKATPREFHIQDILISLPEEPSPQVIREAKQKAEKILQEVKHGENFSKAAITHSAANTALEGGDLGWRTLDTLPEVFAKQVVNMQVGDISGPIQTPNGFHILKVIDVKTDKATAMTHTKAQQLLYAQHFEQAVQNWLQTMRGRASIHIIT